MSLLLVGLGLLGLGALLAALLRASGALGSTAAVAAVCAAAPCVLPAALRALLGQEAWVLRLPWPVPTGGIELGLDPLSGLFLVPLFLIAPPCAVFGRRYLAHAAPGRPTANAWAAYCVLVLSMALVLLARDGLLFVFAWEVMTLSAFVLVSFDRDRAQARRAGWVFLIAGHAGTAALLAFFLVIGREAPGLEFAAAALPRDPAAAAFLFLLALFGFGVKAGLVPLHVWLPEAHAAAPSHVSALLSAVMIKLGLYGILRSVVLLGAPAPWLGALVAGLGLLGAAGAIVLALQQTDLKRSLAYSSVENVGLILLGLGLGLWARAEGRPVLALFGLGAALLHIWNHALMKSLLFLGAGSLLHATGSRELSRLGGLLRRMPRSGTALLVGAVAIAGLPPLNGFPAKWLLYLGLIEENGLAAALAVGLLALIGGLAGLCFVRLAGIALLGAPRSGSAERARESPGAMTLPLLVLALACVAGGVLPAALIGLLAAPLRQISGPGGADPLLLAAPLARLGAFSGLLWMTLLAAALLLWALQRDRPLARAETWGCGYLAPGARMQYTAASFSQLFSSRLAAGTLAIDVSAPRLEGLHPPASSLELAASDPFTRRLFEPFFRRWAERFARLRWLQQGVLPLYLLYILAALVVALLWASLAGERP